MIARFEEITTLSSAQVRFYTVRLGTDKLSEFDKFDNQVIDDPGLQRELEIIYNTIQQIGLRGAEIRYFRNEGPAYALPGKVGKKVMEANKNNYGLRLYVALIDLNNVVLLNGGIKTNLDPALCPNVKDHFAKAKMCAIKLQKAIDDGLIRFSLENGMECDDEEFSIDL